MKRNDTYFMKQALKQAAKAALISEVPVGAVIVQGGKIIARGYNKRETTKNAIYHAEMIAIEKACRRLKSWRLLGCTIYVTLEPCPMCAGAIINSRIDRVVYGADDFKAGACGSVINLFDFPFNHIANVEKGLLKEQSIMLLQDFFRALRK